MPRCERGTLCIFECVSGRPTKWRFKVPLDDRAAGRCPSQDRGPGIPLCSPRPHHSSWPPASPSLHASCSLVVAAVGWGVPPGIALSPLLPRMPGTACGLARGDVTRPFYESRVNRPATEASPAPTPAILMPPSGAPSQPPRHQKSRRRRRRKAARPANRNSVSRQADLATPAAWSANENSARWRATQPRSTANDRPEMRSTSVEHSHSFTSSPLTQLPIPTANQNLRSSSRQDHSEIWGLYKPAQTNPRQDLTATLTRDNISGFGLSSPAPQQPPTKPFSGSPARHLMTDPYREARDAEGERPGIIYPLLPRAAHPDMRLQIDAALPEAAAFNCQTRTPTVLDIVESRLPENHQPQGPRLARRQSRRNRSTGVYRPSKRSPPRGHWCE